MRQLKGVGASSGTVRARACVHRPGAEKQLDPGEILVTEITDPTMFVMILDNAVGIVTDLGGVTSHPAIIARELGIPCVVGVEVGTSQIPHGSTITVDGDAGTIDVED